MRMMTALTLVLGWLGATTAFAGDFAERAILGFSPNGAYFAFEEFGIQDGSGFPYANIFVIETATDSWVAGSPIRVRFENDAATVAAARAQAATQAAPLLSSLAIGTAGRVLASNPPTETSANPLAVDFVLYGEAPSASPVYSLALEELPLPAADCPDMGVPFMGFRLTLAASPGGVAVLNHDTRIPGSRRCPLGYGISDVVTYRPPAGDPVAIVLISIFSVGFEGPDRRFLAVATRL